VTTSELTARPIRTLIVDDHVMLAEGLGSYLSHAPDVDVVGIMGSGQAALESLEQAPVDVLLLDYCLPDSTGDHIAREVLQRWPATKVLIITATDDDDVVARAILAGAHGF
jgi:DNA-binding NarL/FixJ family response regulator